jgi:hypothetical protein
MRISLMIVALCVVFASVAAAQESSRIKRRPPTPEEAARAAAEVAMNDSLLRKGDVVVTDRGFVVFRGVAADGVTNEFEPVKNPLLDRR